MEERREGEVERRKEEVSSESLLVKVDNGSSRSSK
jgi:hypothetical protein